MKTEQEIQELITSLRESEKQTLRTYRPEADADAIWRAYSGLGISDIRELITKLSHFKPSPFSTSSNLEAELLQEASLPARAAYA